MHKQALKKMWKNEKGSNVIKMSNRLFLGVKEHEI